MHFSAKSINPLLRSLQRKDRCLRRLRRQERGRSIPILSDRPRRHHTAERSQATPFLSYITLIGLSRRRMAPKRQHGGGLRPSQAKTWSHRHACCLDVGGYAKLWTCPHLPNGESR